MPSLNAVAADTSRCRHDEHATADVPLLEQPVFVGVEHATENEYSVGVILDAVPELLRTWQ